MPDFDEIFMRNAIHMAKRSLGQTWPNPSVGAVLVQNPNEPIVISRGTTALGGRPHAEAIVLEDAGEQGRGGTLYVTLEPCAHYGKTPPCAEAIIKAGIKRVVISVRDPDPRVAGKGIAMLEGAGIEVVEGVLADEGHAIAIGHISRVTLNRPFIQLKLAVGSDGMVPRGSGKPRWVTGKSARAHAHLMRARTDAILVGSGTVKTDDPELTCRLPGMSDRSPVRIVLDSNLATNEEAALFSDNESARVWIFCAEQADKDREAHLHSAGAEIIRVPVTSTGKLSAGAVVTSLAERGITRLIVEGGPTVVRSFWDEGLADEVLLYRGVKPAGDDAILPLQPSGIDAFQSASNFQEIETRALGEDRLSVFRRRDK